MKTPSPPRAINGVFTAEIDPDLDRITTQAVLDALKAQGAIVLRGGAPDVAGFRRFAEKLCSTSVFNESPNRETIDRDSNVQTVDLGADAFPLHPELSREPWRPDVAMFHCLIPPVGGGETTICDGIEIVDRLPSDLVAEMRSRQLLYIRRATPAELRYWLGTEFPSDRQLSDPPPGVPYRFRAARGMVLRIFARPLLHRTLFDDRLAFGNFLLFARDYLNRPNFPCLDDGSPVPAAWLDAVRTAAATITHPIPWQAGDIALIDNSRVMHGRRAIPDPSHRRIASYFGYLRGVTNPDEPADAIWRREEFRPPLAQGD